MQGILTIWMSERGFGFVQPDATTEVSDRLFIHVKNFSDSDKPKIRLGARIEFTVGDSIAIGKKPQATRAKLLPVETVLAGANALKAGV
jgi:cold shock CspA family protein